MNYYIFGPGLTRYTGFPILMLLHALQVRERFKSKTKGNQRKGEEGKLQRNWILHQFEQNWQAWVNGCANWETKNGTGEGEGIKGMQSCKHKTESLSSSTTKMSFFNLLACFSKSHSLSTKLFILAVNSSWMHKVQIFRTK